jgi:hypothetical protein
MRRTPRITVLGSVAALVAFTGGVVGVSATDANAAGDAGASSLPACVQVTAQARYIPYGYNHVVLIKNGCTKTATCHVSTDVNPQVTSVEVAPNVTSETLTFTGSPAQTFTPHVSCTLK